MTYSGSEEDLIGAGVATAEMFAAREGMDANCNLFRIMRPFSHRKDQRVQRWWAYRSDMSLYNTNRLPGVRMALGAERLWLQAAGRNHDSLRGSLTCTAYFSSKYGATR